MINFRYHLVSLVSVFVALAVGIVLGAGPLSGPIESTFEDQISQLRQDKDALREELEQSVVWLGLAGQGFLEAWPALVEDRLTERRVVVVTVGQSTSERLENLRKGLSLSGATLVGVVHLEERYFLLADAAFTQTADRLVDLGLGSRVEASEQVVGQGLAYVLAGGEAAGAPDPLRAGLGGVGELPGQGGTGQGSSPVGATPTAGNDGPGGGTGTATAPVGSESPSADPPPTSPTATDQAGDGTAGPPVSPSPGPNGPGTGVSPTQGPAPEAIWQVLTAGGLVGGDRLADGADCVIVLVGHLERADVVVERQTTQDRAAAAGALWHALDKRGLPAVVAGPGNQGEDLVALIRADKTQAAMVTTLDLPITAAEVVGVLWAVANGLDGLVGSYGLGAGSGQVLPPIPQVVSPPDEELLPSEPAATDQAGEPTASPPPNATASPGIDSGG